MSNGESRRPPTFIQCLTAMENLKKEERNEIFLKEYFSNLNNWRENTEPFKYEKDLENSYFIVEKINNEVYLMTMKKEKKDVKTNFCKKNKKKSTKFDLNEKDIEKIYMVYETTNDSLIIAKFTSDFYIHIYAQHVSNNDIDKIYLVFITKEANLFFQIMLAYKHKRIKPPPKYSSLQDLCFSIIIEYKLNSGLLPGIVHQNCENYKEYINTFFEWMEWFNKRGWQLRYEPCILFRNRNSVSPKEVIINDAGLIQLFPTFHFETIWQ